jgi:hypothetical protein
MPAQLSALRLRFVSKLRFNLLVDIHTQLQTSQSESALISSLLLFVCRSVKLCLGSRVAVLGANGAGKSPHCAAHHVSVCLSVC